MISIYTTCKNKAQATKIAKELLKKKLAACVNIFPIDSIYLWKNKIISEKEHVIIIKTNRLFKTMIKEIKKLHSYEIPCIEKINVDFNDPYKRWIGRQLK